MKLPDAVLEKLRLEKQDPDSVTIGVPSVKDGIVNIEYFHQGQLIGSVSFRDTPENMNDWYRTMVEAMNPGTDAGAKK
jgi:hypothetical protein